MIHLWVWCPIGFHWPTQGELPHEADPPRQGHSKDVFSRIAHGLEIRTLTQLVRQAQHRFARFIGPGEGGSKT